MGPADASFWGRGRGNDVGGRGSRLHADLAGLAGGGSVRGRGNDVGGRGSRLHADLAGLAGLAGGEADFAG